MSCSGHITKGDPRSPRRHPYLVDHSPCQSLVATVNLVRTTPTFFPPAVSTWNEVVRQGLTIPLPWVRHAEVWIVDEL